MGRGDRRHAYAVWLPVLLVLVVLAAAFASFEYDVARRLGWAPDGDDPSAIEPPMGLELPALPAAPAVAEPAAEPGVDPARVRAALAPYLKDDDLGGHVVAAVATVDGTLVLGRPNATAVPASTMKLLTGAAALEALGPDRTFDTAVVRGEKPGEIVLVGGGDPFLAAAPPKAKSYPKPADVTTLARATAEKLLAEGTARVRLRYDATLFSGGTTSPTWPASYADVVAPIGALWVDQGADPDGYGFLADPAREAAEVFAQELVRQGVKVVRTRPGRAPEAAEQVAVVQSPPVWQVVDEVLAVSDNEGAEVLAHHVAIAEGRQATFPAAAQAVPDVLARLGVPLLARDAVHDGSGLSRADRLTASTLLRVLALGTDPAHPELRTLVTGMPVAAFSGSLASRFTQDAAGAGGRVRAKTGTLSGVHGLAGAATDLDGNTLLFVFLADKVSLADTLDARKTLDDLAAALGTCHCAPAA